MVLKTLDGLRVAKLNKEALRRFKRLRMAVLKNQQHIRRVK